MKAPIGARAPSAEVKFVKRNLSFSEHRELIDLVSEGWIDKGVDWLRERFGEKHYRGHFGLLGNALLLQGAVSSSLLAVPEPAMEISLWERPVRLYADTAVTSERTLGVLEVKVHHSGEREEYSSQLDGVAESRFAGSRSAGVPSTRGEPSIA